jgi:thioredoxin-like negative regulator of GroEL
MSKRDEIARLQAENRRNPDDPHIALELGDLLLTEQRVEEAVALYDHVAKLYEAGGFATKALAVLKGMATIAPTRVDVRIRLSRVLITLGLRTEALATLEQAKLHAQRFGSLADQAAVREELHRVAPPN